MSGVYQERVGPSFEVAPYDLSSDTIRNNRAGRLRCRQDGQILTSGTKCLRRGHAYGLQSIGLL